MMHGGVEEVWRVKESPFVSKMPEDNLHTVGHNEQIVLDLARFGMAVGKFVDSVSEGVSMSGAMSIKRQWSAITNASCAHGKCL